MPWPFCVFIIIIFIIILAVIFEGKRDRLSRFSPEQQKALILQNKVLTLWAGYILAGIFLYPMIEAASPVLANIVTYVSMLLGVGVVVFVAVSSIISRASILRPKHQREFGKGASAVVTGIVVLILLGRVLVEWWVTNVGGGR